MRPSAAFVDEDDGTTSLVLAGAAEYEVLNDAAGGVEGSYA